MSEPLPVLIEHSLQIAWDVLERSGEIDNAAEASRILHSSVDAMVRRGERRRLMLTNRAIDEFRRHKSGLRLVS